MSTPYATERQYLTDLFAGPFPGHAITVDPQWPQRPWEDDCAISPLPVADWVPWAVEGYELQVQRHEAIGDDAVPRVILATGTELFAVAFGCGVHLFEDSNPAAMPCVQTAAEADALEVPSLSVRPLERIFEWAQLVRERVGPEVPIQVPDIQSPFDIAALIWKKESFYLAMYEEPEAVKRLVAKCARLLTDFLLEFRRQVAECSYIHCPHMWAPPELGCSLSEDEVGCLSVGMFEEFCLPTLTQMSETFGGIFMHCCAAADHQYESFKKIPNLRSLNRVFQAPGPKPAVEAFAGQTVLAQAWMDPEDMLAMLDMAHEDSRFLFNVGPLPLDEAKRTYEALRERCPRG
ncbi:MAG: uroporphyrinogen decarboxylase family protein [Armatimonadota bacterium]